MIDMIRWRITCRFIGLVRKSQNLNASMLSSGRYPLSGDPKFGRYTQNFTNNKLTANSLMLGYGAASW